MDKKTSTTTAGKTECDQEPPHAPHETKPVRLLYHQHCCAATLNGEAFVGIPECTLQKQRHRGKFSDTQAQKHSDTRAYICMYMHNTHVHTLKLSLSLTLMEKHTSAHAHTAKQRTHGLTQP